MEDFEILQISGREILDSRGNPTIEAEVVLASGVVGVAAVLQELLPVRTRLSNFVTVILSAMAEKAFSKLPRISTKSLLRLLSACLASSRELSMRL